MVYGDSIKQPAFRNLECLLYKPLLNIRMPEIRESTLPAVIYYYISRFISERIGRFWGCTIKFYAGKEKYIWISSASFFEVTSGRITERENEAVVWCLKSMHAGYSTEKQIVGC